MGEMLQVSEDDMNECPYCLYIMNETEGSSEMFEDGKCVITCANCSREYFYYEER